MLEVRWYLPRELSATLGQENTPVKSAEQHLKEQAAEIRELRKKAGMTDPSTSRALLTQELTESRLPDAAQARLRKQLPATAGKDEIKRAIAQEQDYVWQLRASASRQNQREQASLLAESYRAYGLSERQAEIAAGVEIDVKNVTESRQSLANAARAMGMTDAEAKI